MTETLTHATTLLDTNVAVSFRGIERSFKKVHALKGIPLDVKPGEFLTLLGPSGCGKTTLLRIAAGFERPSAGKVLLDGKDVTNTPAHKRDINMVFQRSTLFPHLDVFGNVAFGLRLEKLPKAVIADRVAEALELVKLTGFEGRRSVEMSGGQVQRVALARALVKRPKVLLLDEPLSALDLKIRLGMEEELRRIHRETGAVFIYVTHDQREALALSDRIAVFNQGVVEQCGIPEDVYHNPETAFIASFVGDANVLPTRIRSSTGGYTDYECASTAMRIRTDRVLPDGDAWLVLRPEQIQVTARGEGIAAEGCGIDGVVADVAFRGTGFAYGVTVDGLDSPVKAEPALSVQAKPIAVGTPVRMTWSSDAGCLLPKT